MDHIMLTLKVGVTLTEMGEQTGLVLDGRVRFAKDARQTQMMRVLVLHSQSLEDLITLLHTENEPTENDHKISLSVAEFILDFGEYLEG